MKQTKIPHIGFLKQGLTLNYLGFCDETLTKSHFKKSNLERKGERELKSAKVPCGIISLKKRIEKQCEDE